MDEMNDTTKPVEEQSPTEKLEETMTISSPVPGAENPTSTEIKRETNFNTE